MLRLPALRLFVLYTALSLCANAAAAADLRPLKRGEMEKLVIYDQPLGVPELPFTDPAGNDHRLSEFRGKVLLVNFWATWCVPCRTEMPTLDRLQAEMGSKDFEVVTIASGRNPLGQIDRFFGEANVTHLPRYQDADQKLARGMGIIGLPVSVLIDRKGREAARLIGGADWNTPEAQAVIRALEADAP